MRPPRPRRFPAYMSPRAGPRDLHLTPASDVHSGRRDPLRTASRGSRRSFGGELHVGCARRVIEDPRAALSGSVPPRRTYPSTPQRSAARCLKKAPQDAVCASAQALATTSRSPQRRPDRREPRVVWGTVSRSLGWRRETRRWGTWSIRSGGARHRLAWACLQPRGDERAAVGVRPPAPTTYLMRVAVVSSGSSLGAPRDPLNARGTGQHGLHFGRSSVRRGSSRSVFLHDGNPCTRCPSFPSSVPGSLPAPRLTYWGPEFVDCFSSCRRTPRCPGAGTSGPTSDGSLSGDAYPDRHPPSGVHQGRPESVRTGDRHRPPAS